MICEELKILLKHIRSVSFRYREMTLSGKRSSREFEQELERFSFCVYFGLK